MNTQTFWKFIWTFIYSLIIWFVCWGVKPLHFSVLLHALPSILCSPSSWFIMLFVLEVEQFICSKCRLFCLVHSDSHYLSQCTFCCYFCWLCTFVLSYSIVDAVAFCWWFSWLTHFQTSCWCTLVFSVWKFNK